MQKIEQDIYINNTYPGVTLGVLVTPRGTIMIDSPPNPEHGRSWGAIVRSLGGGIERILVCLDAHFDRTLGLRQMDMTTMMHNAAAAKLNSHPAIFKGHIAATGAAWETCEGLGGLRWTKPKLTFSEQIMLNWGDYPIILEHHPGPAPGASWLVMPEINVVFVGDTVLVNQPPFLAEASLSSWIEALDLLLSPKYKRYMVVSSRGGIVTTDIIREQRWYLKEIFKRLEKLHSRNEPPESTESLIPKLLSNLDFSPEFQEHYTQRLRYGLYNYYVNNYHTSETETA